MKKVSIKIGVTSIACILISIKVMGRPASAVWNYIPMQVKLHVVTQLARHVLEIFQLRFSRAGSLYMSPQGKYEVGPLVDPIFYEVTDGAPAYDDLSILSGLQDFRGPYSYTTSWMMNRLNAEMLIFNGSTSDLMAAGWTPKEIRVSNLRMEEAIELCQRYPGESPVCQIVNNPDRPFAFMLGDFDLSNIMVPQSFLPLQSII